MQRIRVLLDNRSQLKLCKNLQMAAIRRPQHGFLRNQICPVNLHSSQSCFGNRLIWLQQNSDGA